MAPFVVERSIDAGMACVQVRGHLDESTALHLRNAVWEATDSDQRCLVVDLCGVEVIDAAGIAVLLRCARGMRERGGHLFVACPPGNVRRVLELCMLSETLGVRATREEAVAAGLVGEQVARSEALLSFDQLDRSLRAAGYEPHAPSAEVAAQDEATCVRLVCTSCERPSLAYRPYVNRRLDRRRSVDYRALAVCGQCGGALEF
jgi:anti-sigma B factor antagonist